MSNKYLYHLLVDHKHEALDIILRIKEKNHFFDMAHKYSKCSSAKQNGYLGLLETIKSKLDSDFYEAVLLLKEDEISKPIRTRFGYHLILITNSLHK